MSEQEDRPHYIPVVTVRTLADGDVEYYVSGERVRLILIDERSPNDRVYEWLPRCPAGKHFDLIGDSEIGSSKDDRHAALKHQIENRIEGRPALSLVPVDDEEQS